MNVREIYDSSTIDLKDIKVIWNINKDKNLSFIWNKKYLYLTKKYNNPNKEKRKIIKEIEKKYEPFITEEELIRVAGIYLNEQNELFYIRIHVSTGILIWIHRLDGRFPCYFFKWDGVVKVQNYP